MSSSGNSKQLLYAKQVRLGNTIYNTKRNCDFILFHPIKFPNNLVIECKWQQTKGSVDENTPFYCLILCIQRLIQSLLLMATDLKKGH